MNTPATPRPTQIPDTPPPVSEWVVCGEALIDMIERPDGALTPLLGGSPWNLARALGRLGRPVQYRNPLSEDSFGQRLADSLDESQVQRTGGRSPLPTSLAVVKVDAEGHPDYAFYREGVADRDLDPMAVLADWPVQARVIHVGSLSLLPPDGERWLGLLSALNARGVFTSVDINMRPMVARDKAAYAELAHRVLAQARCVKVSDEDLRAMGHGVADAETAKQVAQSLLSPVTQLVVLTLGREGAWCLSPEGAIFQPPPEVNVVDAVGAGDCFYAGFLAHLDEHGALATDRLPSADALRAALAFGQRVTAFNLQRRGCQPPWRDEI